MLSAPACTLSCVNEPCSRFQPVHVPEPSVEESYEIMLGLRERYEAHHKLRYTDEALMAAAKYSSQYISDRFLPDKASHFTFVIVNLLPRPQPHAMGSIFAHGQWTAASGSGHRDAGTVWASVPKGLCHCPCAAVRATCMGLGACGGTASPPLPACLAVAVMPWHRHALLLPAGRPCHTHGTHPAMAHPFSLLLSPLCVQAIDLIDEAGSRVRLRHAQLPEEARELDKELRALLKEKDAAVR